MTSHALARDALKPHRQDGARRGIGLSVLVHAGLVVALAFGVSWRSRTPEVQQAELWAQVPLAAAARAVEPEPVVEVRPMPTPPVRAVPQVEAPPPAPLPDAQIAIEKARVEKVLKEREAADRASERERKQVEAERSAAAKAAADKLRQQKELAALKKQQAADEREALQRETDRKKNLERIRGMAGASGEPGANGSAMQSAGPSATYGGRIKARVKPNIIFADDVAGNPTAEVEVRAAADGTILGRKLIKSSGIASYDNAVLRAIDKTEVLPRDVDGRVPASMVLEFRPRD